MAFLDCTELFSETQSIKHLAPTKTDKFQAILEVYVFAISSTHGKTLIQIYEPTRNIDVTELKTERTTSRTKPKTTTR